MAGESDWGWSFNPTVVRLRHQHFPDDIHPSLHFQSHCGAIATRHHRYANVHQSRLSIPLWCDCDPQQQLLVEVVNLLSIPLWCDCDLLQKFVQISHKFAFNPTVVRLRPAAKVCPDKPQVRFQSHCGAIATFFSQFEGELFMTFQSHCGAIAT